MKIVINKCYGGFGLSHAAVMAYAKKKGIDLFAYVTDRIGNTKGYKYVEYDGGKTFTCIHYYTKKLVDGKHDNAAYFSTSEVQRDDPLLVSVVEEMKEAANGDCAKLVVIQIPDGVRWEIDEYDGQESVHEQHQSWS